MLSQWIRSLYSDNGTLTDYSIELQNGDAVSFQVVAAEDYLYVGQYFPFNNFYVQVGTANTNNSILSIDYWNGKEWIAAVDILDGTKTNGKTFARNGIVQFSPDIDERWQLVKDTTDSGEPTELATKEIYDLYWLRVKVSANLSAGTTIKKVSYAFCSNASLAGIDPEVNRYLTAWGGSSKTNWDEQILLASTHLVADLRARQLIVAPGEILRFDDVSLAGSYRTLALIYSQLGQPFEGKFQNSLREYEKLLSIKRFTLDVNSDGFVDRSEIGLTTGRAVR